MAYMDPMGYGNYFTSCDPHHDISRCIFGHIFTWQVGKDIICKILETLCTVLFWEDPLQNF